MHTQALECVHQSSFCEHAHDACTYTHAHTSTHAYARTYVYAHTHVQAVNNLTFTIAFL